MKRKGALATVALLLGAALWIEHVHRVDLATPTEALALASGPACPDNDVGPYDASCIAFIGSGDAPAPAWRLRPAMQPSNDIMQDAERPSIVADAACPDNDNRPYPPGCIRFMSGWFWRAN